MAYYMPEKADEIAYHIGFQVDLTEQPTRIPDKLRDGRYCSPVDNGGPARPSPEHDEY